jgi:uncharacterized RDD family membrane protein YckC
MPAAVPFASWGQRVVATLIDGAIVLGGLIVVAIVAGILSKISSALGGLVGLVGYVALIAASFYFAYLTGTTGQSPGKKVMGIQVVHANTGQFIGGGMGIVRNLAHFIDGAICYIGYLLPLFDAKKQTIADKIMTTVVIAGPKQPFAQALTSSLPSK